MKFHLAQLNIARARGTRHDPVMAGFYDNLDRINSLGEASPGFVWRLQDEAGDATSIQAFDDPAMLVNLTVWEDVETLRAFAYHTDHLEFVQRRHEWFERPAGPWMVLWWIPAGTIPTLEEAKERLAMLEREGPSPQAFTFGKSYPPPGEQAA